jgi:type III pantothenate kinase
MMLLAIDAGNSFVKWGYHDGRTWHGQQRVALADFSTDPRHYLATEAARGIVANVAGERLQALLQSALPDVSWQWVQAEQQACGVINSYTQATQLGADRWAALIGARAMSHEPCIVVSAGTALTADLLADDGHFLGGAIAPGWQLMHDALASGTTAIHLSSGEVSPLPINTADAVHTGITYALLGVIEKMAQGLEEKVKRPIGCILTGGAAHKIAPYLNRPVQLVDNLVLEGLLLLAQKENRP